MSLRSALPDKGYQRRKRRDTKVVQGTRIYGAPGEGPSFRCRLNIPSTAERKQRERTTTDPRPRLMTDLRDEERAKLSFKAHDQIRVVSRELGEAIWEVAGIPEPIRKKRRVIGWELPLHRVDEPEPVPVRQ